MNEKNKKNRQGRNSRPSRNEDTRKTDQINKVTENHLYDSGIVKDATALAFSQALGIINTLDSESTQRAVPGILALRITPTGGNQRTDSSPLNIAAKQIYSWVRHANSGRANYESPDLFMYIMAVTNLYAMFSHLATVYGIARTFNLKNRYYAQAIVNAFGYDYEYLISNAADIRMRLNTLALRLNSLAIPKTLPYVTDAMKQFDGVYLDSEDLKAQSIIRIPDSWFKWDAKTSETGSKIQIRSWDYNSNGNMSDAIKALDVELTNLLRDEDINIMSGDILKAYGSEQLMHVGTISEDFGITPIYDPSFLTSLQNTVVTQITQPIGISQENGLIKNEVIPQGDEVYQKFAKLPKFLNLSEEEITTSLVVDATRYFVSFDPLIVSNLVPLYVVTGMVVYSYELSTGSQLGGYYITPIQPTPANLVPVSLLSSFKKHPMLYITTATGGFENMVIGNLDNYTIVDNEIASKIQNAKQVVLFDTFKLNQKY